MIAVERVQGPEINGITTKTRIDLTHFTRNKQRSILKLLANGMVAFVMVLVGFLWTL